MSNGYIDPNTDKSLGTNSNNVESTTSHGFSGRMVGGQVVQVNTSGEPERAMVSDVQRDASGEPLVDVGGMLMSREGAERANLPFVEQGKGALQSIDPKLPSADPNAMAEPGVSVALAQAANSQLENIAANTSPEMLQQLTHAIAVDMDDRALEVIGGNDSPIVQSYIERGVAWTEDMGFNVDGISEHFDDDLQGQMRLAVTRGDRNSFHQMAYQGIQQMKQTAESPETAADIRAAGWQVNAQHEVFDEHGYFQGTTFDLMMRGVLERDE